MSNLPNYIPQTAPKAAVLDLSGRLDSSALARIEQTAAKLSYKAKVVLVPGDYKPTPSNDLHDLARSIADAWSVQGNRFLIVIDLPHKQIRTIGGEGLKSKGITSEFVQNTLLPNNFYPSMRKGDLPGAIENLMQAVQDKVAVTSRMGTTASAGQTSNGQYQSAPTHAEPQINGLGLWGTVLFFGSILLVLVLTMVNFYKGKTKRLRQSLNDRLGDLYQRADQLGQASEYMAPARNKDLALKITAYFEKLTALNKAEDEVEELTKANNFGRANNGLVNCLKLADQLTLEMDELLPAVNAITGGVDNTGENERLWLKKKEALENNLKMQEKVPVSQANSRYYRPTWSNEPQYAPPVYNNGSSLMNVMFLLNQMNMNNGVDQMDWQMNHQMYRNQSYDNPGISDAGGSWGSSSSDSSSNDSGWGDSGGSSSSDSGGDSGGGSDAGGSW